MKKFSENFDKILMKFWRNMTNNLYNFLNILMEIL